jgi:outer membrane receptor for monomeric catechols
VLDAEFTKGSPDAFVEGNTPAYAPDYQFKTGAIYNWKETVKVSMLGTMVDDHFSNADNGFQHFIPAYNVWDLTAEVKFWNNRVGVFAGIKNLFDEDYWAEIRDEGIAPLIGGITMLGSSFSGKRSSSVGLEGSAGCGGLRFPRNFDFQMLRSQQRLVPADD